MRHMSQVREVSLLAFSSEELEPFSQWYMLSQMASRRLVLSDRPLEKGNRKTTVPLRDSTRIDRCLILYITLLLGLFPVR